MGRTPPNIIKLRKQKRNGRRAYLTPIMGLIKVPRRVGKTEVPEEMRSLFDYRGRGNTYWDSIVDKMAPTMLSNQRRLALYRMHELTEKVSPECNVLVREGGITQTKIKFFFQPDYRYCFWIKEDWRNHVIHKSMEYHGPGARDRAYFDLNHNRITWMESVSMELSTD